MPAASKVGGWWLVGLLVVMLVLAGCREGKASSSPAPTFTSPSPSPSPTATSPTAVAIKAPTYGYTVANVYPHDPGSFTEGLAYQDGQFYESSGLYGASDLREVDPATGRVIKMHKLPDVYFGEGLTLFGDKIIQLTWESEVGFVYDLASFALDKVFSYQGQGWGLTSDGTRLIMSNGSSSLAFWDPQTLEPIGSVQVTDDGKPVENLNELEYVRGQVYANVWLTDRVAIIDPQNGRVNAWLDLAGLLQTTNFQGEVDVLNGIAYDAQNDRLFVTGKLWPYLFEVKILK
jgi:glutaminyl-peptide cyclotransferase